MSAVQKLSCIIPVYNESDRIVDVLRVITQVNEIGEIICVDDGSDDGSGKIVKQTYPHITVLTHNHNRGKSEAILTGVKRARYNRLLLLDADYSNLQVVDIVKLIHLYSHKFADHLLLRISANFIDRVIRYDIVLAGARIISKKDILAVFKSKPTGFQLEVAINQYMIKNNKRVGYYSSNARNISKIQKFGLFEGIRRDLVMTKKIIDFVGLSNYIKQILFFATTSFD